MDILALPYGKMLVLGAISAASAFVVTILIVLVCVGCHTKSKSKHSYASMGSQKGVLRQSKLNSMSKSDTRLHEMHRMPCSARGALKDRPASMDLLLLRSHYSTSDLHPPISAYQLNCIPTGRESVVCDRLYPEDEGLYEKVGVLRAPPPAPPLNSVQSQTIPENLQGAGEEGLESREKIEAGQADVMAEYASVKKVKRLERGRRLEGSEEENTSESSSSTVHRQTMESFHIPNIPKGAVSMGNGEVYIWKPPEESNTLSLRGPLLENGHSNSSTTEIVETYSTISKPLKKEHLESTQQISGQIGSGEGSKEHVSWPSGEQYYEAVGENTWSKVFDFDPAYATINPRQKREFQCSSTLKPKKRNGEPMQGPECTMVYENLYESIGNLKEGTNSTSTTTVFTFDDGRKMYVTGL
ncbi:uncharacterized protein LOC132862323 isoform X2 [Tachysurus vachellii]|uniref:uncharacterized protein LOC132862323 isoform X2 n=1 Tax=Tachysurus vachellii TaxID=175792 RepID=UPI00296AFD71|nr:uncharacterized protein LOC132862323 isoform X2 [Tachysurus vachellii]